MIWRQKAQNRVLGVKGPWGQRWSVSTMLYCFILSANVSWEIKQISAWRGSKCCLTLNNNWVGFSFGKLNHCLAVNLTFFPLPPSFPGIQLCHGELAKEWTLRHEQRPEPTAHRKASQWDRSVTDLFASPLPISVSCLCQSIVEGYHILAQLWFLTMCYNVGL